MDYSINDRLKEARLALELSQKAFSKGIFLKSAGYYGDIETHRNEVNERVIELVSSIYGVNKVWLRTGKGRMFDKKIDSRLEEMTVLFNQLNTHFKGYGPDKAVDKAPKHQGKGIIYKKGRFYP
jgi:transcriptional regulator with XRE-family HTH domain